MPPLIKLDGFWPTKLVNPITSASKNQSTGSSSKYHSPSGSSRSLQQHTPELVPFSQQAASRMYHDLIDSGTAGMETMATANSQYQDSLALQYDGRTSAQSPLYYGPYDMRSSMGMPRQQQLESISQGSGNGISGHGRSAVHNITNHVGGPYSSSQHRLQHTDFLKNGNGRISDKNDTDTDAEFDLGEFVELLPESQQASQQATLQKVEETQAPIKQEDSMIDGSLQESQQLAQQLSSQQFIEPHHLIKQDEEMIDQAPATASSQAGQQVVDLLSDSRDGNIQDRQHEDEYVDEDSEDDIPLIQRVRPQSRKQSQITDSVPGRPSMLHNPSKGPASAIPSSINNGTLVQDSTAGPSNNISWKLPTYEAIQETTIEGYPMAKISIPGLIRHEIILSFDHADFEFRILYFLFLPYYKSLIASCPSGHSPALDPKLTLLNFHTITLLIINVFANIREDKGLSARDSDADEVFFAAIDNWRIGREGKRENYECVRGIQEFCDIALDVIFWIKEHGMPEPEGKGTRKRAVRSDKGVKRGSRKEDKNEGAMDGHVRSEKKGGRGKTSTDKGASSEKSQVNTLQARKKPKVQAKSVPVKVEARKKPKIPADMMSGKGGKGADKVKNGRVDKNRK